MSRKVASHRKPSKAAHFRNRKPNFRNRNPISPLMAAVRAVLVDNKPDRELEYLTGLGHSTCQKLLSGHARENLKLLVGMLRSPHGWDVLQAVMADAGQAWFDDLCDLVDINALKRDQLRMKRDLDRREQRLLEARAGAAR